MKRFSKKKKIQTPPRKILLSKKVSERHKLSLFDRDVNAEKG